MSDLFGILVLVLGFGALIGTIACLSALAPVHEDSSPEQSAQKERA